MFFNFIKAIKFINKYNKNSIILLSEGNTYYTTNKPIIDELIKEIDVLYITFEKNDNFFSYNHKRLHVIQLDYDFWGRLLLAMISGKLLITTTPSINVLSLKKSPNIKHYSYYMHAPVDIHSYQKYSFDYFDSIICVGNFQKISLEYLEKIRNLTNKEKTILGLPYADLYAKDNTYCNNDKTILIAPSWGNNNFLNYIDYDIFNTVLSAGYKVIYRPHPMSLLEEKEQINNIINKYHNNENFTYNNDFNNIQAIRSSNILISSISGIILDYILFHTANVLLIDIPEYKTNNLEAYDLKHNSWESMVYNDICIKINSEEELVLALQINHTTNQDIINKHKNEIANFGHSATEISKFLLNKYREL
mgnify:FL=1